MLMNLIRQKLKGKAGESLIETMFAMVIVALLLIMLPEAVVLAANINKSAEEISTTCMMDKSDAKSAEVKISYTGHTELVSDVDGYVDGGFYFYEKNSD